jgi:RNA polymerase sigma factor (sigma-70 family)
MADTGWLAERFQENRSHLRSVAYRMLGSVGEADDAVQETWLRLSRSDADTIENLSGWLTTVVARVCLDVLRSRSSKHEESLDASHEEPAAKDTHIPDPENEVLMAESVGLALLVVLDRLSPAERIAFVLHDIFDVPFEEIGRTLGHSTDSARQLASRARRRVRGAETPSARHEQRDIVERFLGALRRGDVEELLTVLDPDLTVRVDGSAGARPGAPREVHGAETWARGAVKFAHLIVAPQLAVVDGRLGILLAPGGKLSRVMRLTFRDGLITEIEIIADPDKLEALDLNVASN